jgi:hypothetical protein
MLHKPTVASFPFSLFAVSVLSSKWLHLSIHLADVSPQAWAFYLPTVFVSDVIVILAARFLLRRDRGQPPWWGFVAGCIGAYVPSARFWGVACHCPPSRHSLLGAAEQPRMGCSNDASASAFEKNTRANGPHSITSLGGAVSEWTFFQETGGELPWAEAGSYVNNGEGLKVLRSGSATAFKPAAAILTLSWFARGGLYNGAGAAISGLATLILAGASTSSH